jgi:DNA ligase 1
MDKLAATTWIAPMQAKVFCDELAFWPALVQPKINGIRCLWDGRVARTRSERPHTEPIQRLPADWPRIEGVLDGELALDPGTDFEIVQSAVTGDNDLTSSLRFHPFDVILPQSVPFADRYDLIRPYCIETILIRTATQLESAMDRFLEQGHEGLITRHPRGLYRSGSSDSILKYKRTRDAEFTVVDVVEAQGKDAGTAVLVCQTDQGYRFGVRPSGNRATRQRMLRDRQQWIGASYTVRFNGFTRYGVPRNPVGVAERTDIRWVLSIQV